MKFKIEKSKNFWYLIVYSSNKEFTFSAEIDKFTYEQVTDLACNLCKFEGISTEIDFTTRH